MIFERCPHCGGLTNRLRAESYNTKTKKHVWEKVARFCKKCRTVLVKPSLGITIDKEKHYQ